MTEIVRSWNVPTRGVGLPDYSTSAPVGQVATGANIFTSNDNGELAARLGAYQSIDRRGSVVLHDNFEDGINAWVAILGAGAGSALGWSTESFRSGGFSAKISGGLATASSMRRSWGVNEPNKVGIEFSFAVEFYQGITGTNFYSDNVNQYFALWGLTGAQLLIFDANAGMVTVIPNVEALFNDQSFNTVKMVWDTITAKYTRIIFNQLEIDLSQYTVPFLTPPPVVGKHMIAEFQIASAAARNDYAYVDDFIATINEPVNT